MDRQRTELGRILLLDGGGFLHPAGADWRPSSIAMWREMERLGYDAVSLGAPELDQWSLTDSLLQLGTTLPLVATNVERRAGDRWEPVGARCRVVTIDGLRVGFVSALMEGQAPAAAAGRAAENVRVLPAVATVREVARLLKGLAPDRKSVRRIAEDEARRLAREGADLLILIGYLDDASMRALADSIPEIDAILGGIRQPRDSAPARIGRAIVQRPGDRGLAFAATELTVSPANAIAAFDGHAALLDDDCPEDPEVAAVAAAANAATRQLLSATHERMQKERMERFRRMQAQRAAAADSVARAQGDSLPPAGQPAPGDPPRPPLPAPLPPR